MKQEKINRNYEIARELFAELGIDTEAAISSLQKLSLSLHCWQTDDVSGFENPDGSLSGGIQATGNYPGKARNIDEVRADIEKVNTLIPGNHRLSLHAIYGDFKGKKVDRNEIEPEHFQSWIDWAKLNNMKLDFNSTSFSHSKSGNLSLSNRDKGIRDFWIEHTIRSRRIADEMGRQLKSKACHNLWIHDGSKDITVDRYLYRSLLKDSLDKIFENKFTNVKDAVECKLFGTGLESFTVGSHEFYMGYAMKNGLMATLDMGHFHPTEETYDKISSLLLFSPEIMLHVSRPVRWDSDHVVILNDSVQMLAQEIIWANALERVNVGLDYFDASINRIGAYVIGIRATQKAFLQALLTPIKKLREYEASEQGFERLALLEESKTLPWNDVYNYFCMLNNVPVAEDYISEVEKYEKEVTSKRWFKYGNYKRIINHSYRQLGSIQLIRSDQESQEMELGKFLACPRNFCLAGISSDRYANGNTSQRKSFTTIRKRRSWSCDYLRNAMGYRWPYFRIEHAIFRRGFRTISFLRNLFGFRNSFPRTICWY